VPSLSHTATVTIAVADVEEGTGLVGAPRALRRDTAWIRPADPPAIRVPAMPTPGYSIPLKPAGGGTAAERYVAVTEAEPADGEAPDAVAAARSETPAAQDERTETPTPASADEPAEGAAGPSLARTAGAEEAAPKPGDPTARPSADDVPAGNEAASPSGERSRVADFLAARPRLDIARSPSDEAGHTDPTTPEPRTDPTAAPTQERDAGATRTDDLAAARPGGHRVVATAACGLSAAATAGYAVWCGAKGVFSMQAAASCTPLWRWVDPTTLARARTHPAGRRRTGGKG